MTLEVVLLRAVNVGARKLSMAALRAGLEQAGCTDVVTYVQSGNVVLRPPDPRPDGLQAWLEGVISDVAGFSVPVVLRTGAELEETVARNPYPDAGGTQLHVVFFAEEPPSDTLDGLDLDAFRPDSCALLGRDLYMHLPGGMGRAKLPIALEKAGRKARPPALGTSRNWNTVLKLVALAQE
ncbi:MAG: hypothetical protein AVDCRST_MAG50-1207 [uncultured Acidimicrobiales bacterium]|uniref:DUF1697 domain-containing protein n=1 Tax=uncultured Acidimicrobiales bacterium TaxID=310071 RepID=A0A6J4HUE0_9ACTN|nr:MAG: hypothetical protein AVDCRST_MAG50-1207 [uncultured Acidimicrobiales bacterium]